MLNKRKIIILAVILTAIVGLCIIFSINRSKTNSNTEKGKVETVATTFFEDLYSDKDHSKDAYALASSELKQSYTQSEFTSRFAKSGFIYKSISFADVTVDGNSATIRGTVSPKDRTSGNLFSMKLVKPLADWKIYSFDVL